MTRDEALKRAKRTWRGDGEIADALLAVERETESRVAEECAAIVNEAAKVLGQSIMCEYVDIADDIRRKYPKQEGR